MSGSSLNQSKKAGLSGLFRCGAFAALFLLSIAGTAAGQSLAIELVSVQVDYDQRTNEPIISFKMSQASGKAFAELTSNNVGRKLEIRVDGKPLWAPIIREPLLGGWGQIRARFTEQQARDIAAKLYSGASKLELVIVD